MAKKRPYDSLNDWMERTQRTGDDIQKLLREKRGILVSRAHVSNILKGSRRCSLALAIELHEMTADLNPPGVPIKAIAEWPRSRSHTSSAFDPTREKVTA